MLTSTSRFRETSSGSSTSGSGINQLLVGTSNGSNTTNSFLGLQNTCTSNQGLDTTQSVDCQSEFSTKQIQLTPYSSASNKCSTLGSIEEVADCAGAAGTLVACASPESGIGELICGGGWDVGFPQACFQDVATQVAQSLVSNPLAKAGVETISNIFTLAQGTDSVTGAVQNLIGVGCNAD